MIRSLVLAGALAGSATLMALAIGSPRYGWLGWITLVPLFLAIRTLSPLRSMLAGGFWGLSLFVAFAASGYVTWQGFWPPLLAVVLAPSLYSGWGARITLRRGFRPLLLALGWVGVEFALRPLAIHNGLLAGTQNDGWIIRIAGQLGGYLFVAFLLACVNALILAVLSSVPGMLRRPLVLKVAAEFWWRLPLEEIPVRIRQIAELIRARAPPHFA